MLRAAVLMPIAVVASVAAAAQSAEVPKDAPKFEVVSIRPSDPHWLAPRSVTGPERFVRGRTTVNSLIEWAYDARSYQVVGAPAWTDSRQDAYDIQAKIAGTADAPAIKLMVQSMLADRFQLKFHREMRQLPIYALVVAKSGPKLRAAKPLEKGAKPHLTALYGTVSAASANLHRLADVLTVMMDRPVFDQTAIEGKFDFELEFDQSSAGEHKEADPADAGKPNIFTAVEEQLGLKLEPQRAPVEMLVVDSVTRPSAN